MSYISICFVYPASWLSIYLPVFLSIIYVMISYTKTDLVEEIQEHYILKTNWYFQQELIAIDSTFLGLGLDQMIGKSEIYK